MQEPQVLKSAVTKFQFPKLESKIFFISAALFIYVLIFFQGFFSVSLIPIIFRVDILTNISPAYLLVWGMASVFFILPLTFALIVSQKNALKQFFFSLNNTKKVIQIAFWSTFAFTILGFIFYPYFLNRPAIGWESFLSYFPYFILYSIGNGFVEEAFFRGALLSKFSEWWGNEIGNNIQALFFALIHLVVIPFNPSATYFILLTFILGYFFGYITLKTKSIFPAIILHIVADLFFAVSLF